jgi:hypothetical protein
MSGRGNWFPFLYDPQEADPTPRPLVLVRLTNAHAPERDFVFPALIDTGADRNTAPLDLCRLLGHDFEKGESMPGSMGVGAGVVRAFAHDTVKTVHGQGEDGAIQARPAFGPFRMPMEFIEQDLPFILLG